MFDMRRREFITLLGGAAASWPLAARAQQPAMPVVGFLSALGRNDRPNLAGAFRRGLSETGFVDGRNVAIEYRFAEYQPERLPALAANLVDRKAAVIVATGGANSIAAAKATTTTVPIVFSFGGDPVLAGFVSSHNRPGGNITGVTFFNPALSGKGLGLLIELVPTARVIAFLANTNLPESGIGIAHAEQAARTLDRQLVVVGARTPDEINKAFADAFQRGAHALLVASDPFFSARRQQFVALAARDAIPVMYFNREFVAEGGLMSYGNDPVDAYRRAGVYCGRILNGASPADLPIDQATKFEFVINLKTAKALGLDVPPMLIARADEVIE
jgi:putative ABC transport system substrate-binding protein